MKHRVLLTVVLLTILVIPRPRASTLGEMTLIEFPGAVHTRPAGISENGTVSGIYIDSAGLFHGFLYDVARQEYTTMGLPGIFTTIAKINALGEFTGFYQLPGAPLRGYVHKGWFTKLDFPGALGTTPAGINESGDVVGSYRDQANVPHAFLYRDGQFTSFQYPGGTMTAALDINSQGDIVGRYQAGGVIHMFLLSNGVFTSIDVPGAVSTGAAQSGAGLNTAGEVVGQYDAADGKARAFLKTAQGYTTFDFPDTQLTVFTAISDTGDIVGRYRDLAGRDHGFLMRR